MNPRGAMLGHIWGNLGPSWAYVEGSVAPSMSTRPEDARVSIPGLLFEAHKKIIKIPRFVCAREIVLYTRTRRVHWQYASRIFEWHHPLAFKDWQHPDCPDQIKDDAAVWSVDIIYIRLSSRMRSEGSRLTLGVWGWGRVRQKLRVRPQPFATVRNRPQPSVTVRNRLRECRNALHSGECCRKRFRKWVKWTRDAAVVLAFANIGVCRGGVCVTDLYRRNFIDVCRAGVCVTDLWRRIYFGVVRGGVSASDLWRRRFMAVCSGGLSVSDLCRRIFISVCREGVCASASHCWRRSCVGICTGRVCMSDLWRRNHFGVCRGDVCVSDLWRRSYVGVCRGDLCRWSFIGVCTGGVSVSELCVCVSSNSVLEKCEKKKCHVGVFTKLSNKGVSIGAAALINGSHGPQHYLAWSHPTMHSNRKHAHE